MKKSAGEKIHNLRDIKNVLVGLLIGSLTGAAVMVLFAPQSGQQFRSLILERGIQLRRSYAGNPYVLSEELEV